MATQLGAEIAVENMAHDCIGNTIAELEELAGAHPRLRVCFDTNHLLNENATDLIHRLGKRIVTLHVSDCDLENERHWMPGEGKVDFAAILRALGEVGYSGPWLYEVSYKCPRGESDPCGLSCESFAKNADELFTGKAFTAQREPRR